MQGWHVPGRPSLLLLNRAPLEYCICISLSLRVYLSIFLGLFIEAAIYIILPTCLLAFSLCVVH